VSFIGELLGYDSSGIDLFGAHQDEGYNCVVCGTYVYLHSPEQHKQCMAKASANFFGKSKCGWCGAADVAEEDWDKHLALPGHGNE
jgi:hypothetical protein